MIGIATQHVAAADVANELREARLRAHLSQAGMALELGVSRRTICRWESGRGRLHRVYLRRVRQLRQTQAEVASNAQ